MFANIATASLDFLLAARDETLEHARRYDREFAALSESDKQCRCGELSLIPCDRCAILRNAREEWARYQTFENEICARISL